jgi:methionine synthase I (cobalamin-dependent)
MGLRIPTQKMKSLLREPDRVRRQRLLDGPSGSGRLRNDSATTLQDSREDWVAEMLKLNRHYGVKILGGCCGTDDSYLRDLVAGP